MKSRIFIGPPGVGKTTFKKKHIGRFIDPEDSIDWNKMNDLYNLYPKKDQHNGEVERFEHELDWPTIWVKEVLPRIKVAMILEKDIVMGLITPSNVEIVRNFLKDFKKETTLILPDEKTHFARVWGDDKKRPRSWGSQIRGWQHTFWIRILLLGLAKDLGLNIVEDVGSVNKNKSLVDISAKTREVSVVGGRYIEIFLGRWAKIDSEGQIVAMFDATEAEDKISLHCDRTSKTCGKGLHDCQKEIKFEKGSVSGVSKNWIARDKFAKTKRGEGKNAVIFFVGTLAPFHAGHLNLLNGAKKFLQSKGWNVLGGYASAFVNVKNDRAGELSFVLNSKESRTKMLSLGTLNSDWIMPDFPVEHVLRSESLASGKHPVQRVASRLREAGVLSKKEKITTFWVNGKDGHMDKEFFAEFAKHADSDKLNPLRMLIIGNREGKDLWSKNDLHNAVPEIVPFIFRYNVLMSVSRSATAVRNALLSGNRIDLKDMVGIPSVEAYLIGMMHEREKNK